MFLYGLQEADRHSVPDLSFRREPVEEGLKGRLGLEWCKVGVGPHGDGIAVAVMDRGGEGIDHPRQVATAIGIGFAR